MHRTLFVVIIILSIMGIGFFGYGTSYGQGSIIYSIPPAMPEMYIIGDNIYFLHEMGTLGKHSKQDLSEIDTLDIHKCLNITYSVYLDRIIAHADFDPSYIVVIDYQNMEVESTTAINQRTSGLCTSGDKLYITIDGWALPFGSHYQPADMPENTGILREINLDDMSANWEVNIGTIPDFVIDAGDYVITSAYETRKDEVLKFQGSIISVVDKSTQVVRQFVAGPAFDTHLEYDGEDTVIISNPNGAYATERPAGISILHLDTWEIEHVVLDRSDPDAMPWKVNGTCINGNSLYMAYFNSKYDDKTFFGIMDTTTGEYEDIELSGISQYLTSVEVDGDNVYFSTLDGWFIKYTPD